MADIIITPGSSLMSFTSSLNYTQTLTQQASGSLTLQGSGSTGRTDLFTVNGNNGTLFSVSDDLSNSLFSVNTIAGLPVIEAFADNTVVMGQYGQNVLVVTGSRVGIGTPTPNQKLSVEGGSIYHNYNNAAANYYLYLNRKASQDGGILLLKDNTTDWQIINEGSGGDLKFYSYGISAFALTMAKSTGNVGIGTTSPGAKLDVDGGIRLSTSERVEGRTYPYTTNIGSGADATTTYLDAGSTAGSLARIAVAGGSATDPNTIKFSTTSTERMRITAAGNVGIGTASPNAKLHIAAAALGTSTNDYVLNSIHYNSNGNSEELEIKSVRESAGSDWTYGGKRIQLRIDSTYMGYMQFNGYGNQAGISFGTGTTVTAPGNVTERMRINSSGNVGIGTTSPAVPLDVNGSTNIKGAITGQDSSGNYRYEFAPELAYTRVGVGSIGTYKINSGAVSTTSMLRIKSTSISGWLSSQANYFNGTVISDGLCDVAISTVGTLLFLNSNGEWGIADADIAAKSVTLLGIALNSTSGVGETVDVLIDGIIALKSNHDQISIPASPGAPLYVSTNAGNVTEVAPAVSGDIVRLVGHNVWSATSPQNTAIIRFQPDNTWIEL